MKKVISFIMIWLCLSFLVAALPGSAQAANLVAHSQGTYLNAPDYDWWYGCSPTSAGMMMGYYDRNGYNGLCYDNLVPGGVAELSTFTSTAGTWNYLAQYAIASPEHVSDFYQGGYLASGDDVAPPYHSFNCLADFMGTSQDSAVSPPLKTVGNKNGSTTFWYYDDGYPTTAQDIVNAGLTASSGMYGLYEYLVYAGYGAIANLSTDFYNQYIDALSLTYGFTFAQYMAEIDAGRVVLVHIEGHTMLGYGYETDGTMYIHDTWSEGDHTMTWGGSYSGYAQKGVTVFIPSGGAPCVPLPGTVVLLGSGLLGLVVWRRQS
ncbi:MAG: PEP-CTERM sorting domain-containing protein [Desulfobacca sp.]|nr:PEP-CTERM sorting domain-containing protein [Desulfobacca sp.]